AQKAYLACVLIMSVFMLSILPGCGGGGGGVWNKPITNSATRPTVASTVPATTTPVQIVLPGTAVTATFNKDMAPASITSGTFTVTRLDLTPVTGAAIPVTYDVASKTATFHPAAALAPGTYIATIKATGPSAATDSTGNALAG